MSTSGPNHRYIVNRHDAGQSASAEIAETLAELEEQFGPRAVYEEFRQTQAGALITGNTQQVQEAVNYVLCRVIDAQNPRMEADVMALASGALFRQGISERDIARKYGVTVAAISKRAVEFCERTGLEPSQLMRPKRDREIYRMTNRTRV